MKIQNVTLKELEFALEQININRFYSNIEFYDGTPESLNKVQTTWRVRLAPKNVHMNSGVLRGQYDGRRLKSCCWHVHGAFFDYLPPLAKIYARGRSFMAHDTWKDWNSGSEMFPIFQSTRCVCAGYLAFTPIKMWLQTRGYASHDLSNVPLKAKLAELDNVQVIIEETQNCQGCVEYIDYYLKDIEDIEIDIVPMRVSCLERWDEDVVSRFESSFRRYEDGNVI